MTVFMKILWKCTHIYLQHGINKRSGHVSAIVVVIFNQLILTKHYYSNVYLKSKGIDVYISQITFVFNKWTFRMYDFQYSMARHQNSSSYSLFRTQFYFWASNTSHASDGDVQLSYHLYGGLPDGFLLVSLATLMILAICSSAILSTWSLHPLLLPPFPLRTVLSIYSTR